MESLTRPFFHHRRKLSNVNSSNGLSFSGKDAYDDVLLGAPKSKLGGSGASRGVVVEDYGEIFGVGGGNVKRGSSIPVLDLSDLDKTNDSCDSQRSNGKLDYSKIFGSFAPDDDVAMAVPPYEELFGGVKKAKCDKAKARTPADIGSPLKGSERFNSSENNRGFSSEASDQFLDGGKQLNMSYHKTSQPSKNSLNGKMHIAQLHAVPGFTYFINEAARPQKSEHDKPFPQVKTDTNHSRSSSGDLSEGKSSRRAKWRLPDRQASEGLVNGKDDRSQDEFDLKPYPPKVSMPSSSAANLNDNQGNPKQEKSSSFGPKTEASEKDSGGYVSPSSDEELDVSSAAAASAAALKKAIQQAQESIRIAKEIMERKKDTIQNSKSRTNGSLKVKNRKEIKYNQDTSGVVRKHNTKEAHKNVNSEVQAFGRFDQENVIGSDEVASGFTCRENLSIDREVDVEKHEECAEVTEEQGVGTWFTQLLNNGKNKMAALASQLVDNRNTIFQPTNKHLHDAEETIPAKDTLEGVTTGPGDNDAKLDALGKAPDLEKNLGKSVSDQFVQGGTGSVTLMSAQEDEATKVEHGFDRREKCEKMLQHGEETTYDRHFEPGILENGCSADELSNRVEMKKEQEKSFEMEMGRKRDDVLMWQKNESRLDENWRMQEDSCLQKSIGCQPKEDIPIESSEKKQENSQAEDFSGNRLEGYHQQDIDDALRPTCSVGGVEQNISEEEKLCEGIDQRPTRTYQHKGTVTIDAGADNSTESEKIEVNLEAQESDNTEGETYKSKENPRAGLFPEAAYEENLNACIGDESTISGGTPEASEVHNNKQTRQLEITDFEENAKQTMVTGLRSTEEDGHIEFKEDKEEAEQAVEEASVLKENKMFETSCLGQSVTQEQHVLENVIQDIHETFASDDNTKNIGSDTTIHEEKPSMDRSVLKTTGLTTKEHAIESENATDAPPAGEKMSDCDFADVDGQKETEESDEEYEFSIRPESSDGLVHESGGDAKNIKEDGDACNREVEKRICELYTKEKDWVEKHLEPECSQLPSETKENEEHLETDTEMKAGQSMENYEENIYQTSVEEEKENRDRVQKEVTETDSVKKIEVAQREREREKDRIAVERAIREARERAFAEARERAERAAVERATAEVRQRAMAGAREKLEKVSAGTKVPADKATTGAKLRAERAAVERATAEARERALEKALSHKSTSETRAQVEKVVTGKSAASRDTGLKHSFSSSDLEGAHNESAQRRKARLERHQRIMERAAKALAEKNMRDILAQREQAERNRLAETLDADIKRWASGKEGNLRALLSTLQYILGPDSGWQPISLTEIITTSAVKKAYRKATLYVHPDKLQQRGASIQQKYICEKIFDLLKAAWNKFNSEER